MRHLEPIAGNRALGAASGAKTRLAAAAVSALLLLASAAACSGEPAEAPLWEELRGEWNPAATSGLFSVYGRDGSAASPGRKSEDKWLTVELRFHEPARRAFGVYGLDGFMALSDSGAVSLRLGVPPGTVLLWGFAPTGGNASDSTGLPIAVLLDRASRISAGDSVRPVVERDYYARWLLYYDLDGDEIAEAVVMIAAAPRSGFQSRSGQK